MEQRKVLSGWKEIRDLSKALGGPSSERHLRRLAVERGMPVYAGGASGTVQAIEEEIRAWFKRRNVHLGARLLSDRVRSRPAKSESGLN
jgi:hypothetical protein